MYPLLNKTIQAFFSLPNNHQKNPGLQALREAFFTYVDHLCVTSLKNDKGEIINNYSHEDVRIGCYTQFMLNASSIDDILRSLQEQKIAPSFDAMAKHFAELQKNSTLHKDTLNTLNKITSNALDFVQKEKSTLTSVIDKPYKAYLEDLLANNVKAVEALERIKKRDKRTAELLPLIRTLKDKVHPLEAEYLATDKSITIPQQEELQADISNYKNKIQTLEGLLEKNETEEIAAHEQLSFDTEVNEACLKIRKEEKIQETALSKEAKSTYTDNERLHALIAAHNTYITALSAFPFILDTTITAAQAGDYNFDVKGANKTLISFLKGIVPESCPKVIFQMICVYINSTGMGHQILTPAMQQHLVENLLPFINALTARSNALEAYKTNYLYKGDKANESNSLLINTRKEYLRSLGVDVAFNLPEKLSKLAELGTDVANIASNIQGILQHESLFDQIGDVINAVKSVDDTLTNPFMTYALKNVPQAEQLLHYYTKSRCAISYMSDMLAIGISKIEEANDYLQKVFGITDTSAADLQEAFKKELVFFKFYQLVESGKIDPAYQQIFFEKHINDLIKKGNKEDKPFFAKGNPSFKEYRHFVTQCISDRDQPVSFPEFTLKECILNCYKSEFDFIDGKTTQLYGKLASSPRFNFLYIADHLKRFEEKLQLGQPNDPDRTKFIIDTLIEIDEACKAIHSLQDRANSLEMSVCSAGSLFPTTQKALLKVQETSINPLMEQLLTELASIPQDKIDAYQQEKQAVLDVIRTKYQPKSKAKNSKPVRTVRYHVADTFSPMVDKLSTAFQNGATAFADHYLEPNKNRCQNIRALYQDNEQNLNEETHKLYESKIAYMDSLNKILRHQDFSNNFASFLKNNVEKLKTIADPSKLTCPSLPKIASHVPYFMQLVLQLLPQHITGNYDLHALSMAFLSYLDQGENVNLLTALNNASQAFTNNLRDIKDLTLLTHFGDPTASLNKFNEELVETIIEAASRIQEGFGEKPVELEKRMANLIKQGLEQALASSPLLKFVILETFKTEKVQNNLHNLLKKPADFLRNQGKETLLNFLGIETAQARETLAADYLSGTSTTEGHYAAFASCFLQYRSLVTKSSSALTPAFQKNIIKLIFSNHIRQLENNKVEAKEIEAFTNKMFEKFQDINTAYFSENTSKEIANNETAALLIHLIDVQEQSQEQSMGRNPLMDHLITELLSQLSQGVTINKGTKQRELETILFKSAQGLLKTQNRLKTANQQELPSVLLSTLELVFKQSFQGPLARLHLKLDALAGTATILSKASAPIKSNEANPEQALKVRNGYVYGESYLSWKKRNNHFLQNAFELIGTLSTLATTWTVIAKLVTAAMGFSFIHLSGLSVTILASAIVTVAAANVFKVLLSSIRELVKQEDFTSKSLSHKIISFGWIFVKSLGHTIVTSLFSKHLLSKIKPLFPFFALAKDIARQNKAHFPEEGELSQENATLTSLTNAVANASEYLKGLPGSFETKKLPDIKAEITRLSKVLSDCIAHFESLKDKDARLFLAEFSQTSAILIKQAITAKKELDHLQTKLVDDLAFPSSSAQQQQQEAMPTFNKAAVNNDPKKPLDPLAYAEKIQNPLFQPLVGCYSIVMPQLKPQNLDESTTVHVDALEASIGMEYSLMEKAPSIKIDESFFNDSLVEENKEEVTSPSTASTAASSRNDLGDLGLGSDPVHEANHSDKKTNKNDASLAEPSTDKKESFFTKCKQFLCFFSRRPQEDPMDKTHTQADEAIKKI